MPRNFSMPTVDNKNSVHELFSSLRMDSIPLNKKNFVDSFNFSENKQLSYWRTEFRPYPFSTKDFIKIQSYFFEKGWLHTNFFYQSNGRLSIDDAKSLTPEFLDKLIVNSFILAHKNPASDDIVIRTSVAPPDECFVYILCMTSDSAAVEIKKRMLGLKLETISNPRHQEDQPFIVFSDNHGRPIVFSFVTSKSIVFHKKTFRENIIPFIPEFNPESIAGYKITKEEKFKIINNAFESYVNNILSRKNIVQFEERIENKYPPVNFGLIYKRLLKNKAVYETSLILNAIEKYKALLAKLDNSEKDFNSSEFSMQTVDVVLNLSFLNAFNLRLNYYNNNCGIANLYSMDRVYPSATGVSKNGIQYSITDYLTPEEIADQSFIHQSIEIIDEFYGKQHSRQDMLRLKNLVTSSWSILNHNTSESFIHARRFESLYSCFYEFIIIINMAIHKILTEIEYSYLNSLDLNIKENFNSFCYQINDIIFEEWVQSQYKPSKDSEINIKDKFLKMVKYFLNKTKTKITKIDENEYISFQNIIGMSDFYFKNSSEWYTQFLKITNDFENVILLHGSSHEGRGNQFFINEDTGKICFVQYSDSSTGNLTKLNINPKLTNYSNLSDRLKKVLVFDISEPKNDKGKYNYHVCNLYTPSHLNDDGTPAHINSYQDLSNVMLSENSGLDIYFQFISFISEIEGDGAIHDFKTAEMSNIFYKENSVFGTRKFIDYYTRSFKSAFSNSENSNIMEIDIVRDEVDIDQLNMKFDNIELNKMDDFFSSFTVTTNPVLVEANDMTYSLGRIKYNLTSKGIEHYSFNNTRPIFLDNEGKSIYYRAINNRLPELVLVPCSAYKFSSAMTSFCPGMHDANKSGHPHFSRTSFICHNGQGTTHMSTFIYDLVDKSREMKWPELFTYSPGRNELFIRIKKSIFVKWIDELIFQMDNLTKSNYNRKTRSHSGLNIEEWTHCRIR